MNAFICGWVWVCVCFVLRVFTLAAHSRSDVKAITLFPFDEAQNADYSDVGKQQEQPYEEQRRSVI